MNANFLAGQAGRAMFDDFQSMMDVVLRDAPMECMSVLPGPGPVTGERRFVETDAVRLDACRWSSGALVRSEGASGSVRLGLVDGDPSLIRFRGQTVGPIQVPLVPSGAEFEFMAPIPVTVHILTIDQVVFQRHSAALWGDDPALSAACMLRFPCPAQSFALLQKVKGMLSDLSHRSTLLQAPSIASLATDDILLSLITSSSLRPQRIALPYRHHLAREAAAMLRSATDLPLSIREVCERLRISWRTLDQGFRELYGMTPKSYLQLVRMHHVRRALQAADPTISTVTTIAVSWGFFQLGRFALEYRRLFDEKPSETLRKRRGQT